ncbi:hypothetical protein I4U23_028080 [Adineta vaga]|nr:hypothetical protein I4U23_028080 [Adineta vaga]
MAKFSLVFRLLCLIYCFIAVTSDKIDQRSSIKDRNKRAVTEWRFRRNRLPPYSYFLRNHVLAHSWANDDSDSQSNERNMAILQRNSFPSKSVKQ